MSAECDNKVFELSGRWAECLFPGALDFPAVDVKADDSGVAVSFENPFRFYKELMRTVDTSSLKFTVHPVSDNKTRLVSMSWTFLWHTSQKHVRHSVKQLWNRGEQKILNLILNGLIVLLHQILCSSLCFFFLWITGRDWWILLSERRLL